MHTSPPWQDRELCVLYIQGVFSTMTYSPAAHANKACLGLRKKKRFFYFWRTSWKLKDWTDMAWRSVHLPGLLFTADTLLLTFPCPPSQMVPNVTFCCGDSWGKSLTWFDNSGINVKRGIHVGERGHTPEGKQKENNNTKTRNYQNSIQARMWQLRAGLLRPLMMGPRLSICEEDPDGCNVSTEWVSGFMPCHS